MRFDPKCYFEDLAGKPDKRIDLALGALALAAGEHEGISVQRYISHLRELMRDTQDSFAGLLREGREDVVETRRLAIAQAFALTHGYKGVLEDYDNPASADLMQVIDRRKGLPVALCILCLHIGRALGWDIEGLNMPGRFVCRLDHEGARMIFDPFHACAALDAADLRKLVKNALGEQAELSSQYYAPVSNREILIRLQNHIKLLQIESGDYEGALQTVEKMRGIDPDEYRLLLDAGVLYVRTERPRAAIDALEEYIKKSPHDRDRHDAATLLQQIRESLH